MPKHRPLIAISGSEYDARFCVKKPYAESVRLAGGMPLIVPITRDEAEIADIVTAADGILLTGGEDIDPRTGYREAPHPALGKVSPERDEFDIKLARAAVKAGKPVLGICRGHQVLCVAFGGSLYQDIPSQCPHSTVRHVQTGIPRPQGTHTVSLEDGSLLKNRLGTREILVNSFHHQAVKVCPDGFRVTATAPDGVIEGIERVAPLQGYPDGGALILGVQFHPEDPVAAGNPFFLPLFSCLVHPPTQP